MKALVGAFNQENALVGAFSVIVQPVVEPMDRFTALLITLRSGSVSPDIHSPTAGLHISPLSWPHKQHSGKHQTALVALISVTLDIAAASRTAVCHLRNSAAQYTTLLATHFMLQSLDHRHTTFWTILYKFVKESFALKCRDDPRRKFADLVLGAQV